MIPNASAVIAIHVLYSFLSIAVLSIIFFRTVLIRTAGKQPDQRTEQKAFAQSAVAMMTAMAAMAAKDHVPQGQDTKQTQHFSFLRSFISHVPVIRYVYMIRHRKAEKQNQM